MILFSSICLYLQVILTTLLKVYARGSLFEKSRDLLAELEALGYAEDEVHQQLHSSEPGICDFL